MRPQAPPNSQKMLTATVTTTDIQQANLSRGEPRKCVTVDPVNSHSVPRASLRDQQSSAYVIMLLYNCQCVLSLSLQLWVQ